MSEAVVVDAFGVWLNETREDRPCSPNGAPCYDEHEWYAFVAGFNAAADHLKSLAAVAHF